MTEISIIIPVYGCKDCLIELHSQLTKVLQPSISSYEIIFIDDCSKDKAWDLIYELSQKDSHVKAIKFSRNFGQHAAITAGLAECSGDYAVVMDCDLQDPPHEILHLYNKSKEGYDIVFAKRMNKKHSFFRKMTSTFFFKLMNSKSKNLKTFDSTFGGFSIISRKVITSFLRFHDKDRHYLFILRWLGFDTAYIEYDHAPRYCGKSSYNLIKLVRFSIQGICSQTTTLLKIIVFIGFIISFVGFLLAGYYIFSYFIYSAATGWTSLITTMYIMSGIIVSSVGIVGLYIGKIFEQVKDRPLYIIDKKLSGNSLLTQTTLISKQQEKLSTLENI